MHGIGRELQTALERLHAKLMTSPVGQRWERMLRQHAHEIESILAVHPQVQADVADAVGRLDATQPFDADDCVTLRTALDDLHRFAGIGLQRDIVRMRDEVALAKGRTLDDLLSERTGVGV